MYIYTHIPSKREKRERERKREEREKRMSARGRESVRSLISFLYKSVIRPSPLLFLDKRLGEVEMPHSLSV